jgi:RNA-directed DNA polymerase
VSEPKPNGKPFAISKRLVWEAWLRVKANQGAAGVDEESIRAFEANLAGNLYKLWNRLCSGSYMPPPVRAVEIPKRGGGTRVLGVPTVADRVAQTVVHPVPGARGGALLPPRLVRVAAATLGAGGGAGVSGALLAIRPGDRS